MAPEYLTSVNGYVAANLLLPADVFSLGYLIYAIIEQKEPHCDSSLVDIVRLTSSGSPLKLTNPDWTKLWRFIVEGCWKFNPSERLTADEIVDEIHFARINHL